MTLEQYWWGACSIVGFIVLCMIGVFIAFIIFACLVGVGSFIWNRAEEGMAIMRGRLKFGERP